MIVFESSDWHCNPVGLSPEAKDFIKLGKEKGATLTGNGDLFNFLPLGRDAFKKAKVFEEFKEALDGYPFDYIAGNHDPFLWAKKELRDIPNIRILRTMTVSIGGREYRFFHGHQRSDWALWRYIAPSFVEFATDHFPKLWYEICQRLGWLPSTFKEKAKTGKPKEKERFNALVLGVQGAWKKYAEDNEVSVVIGHTHKADLDYWFNLDMSCDYLVDGGNLKDGTFVIIDEEGPRLEIL